jgi:putative hemolysin
MKKSILITSLLVLIIVGLGALLINQLKLKSGPTKSGGLCADKGGCCQHSLDLISKNGYQVMPENGCPQGYRRSMLKCSGSLVWCEKQSEQDTCFAAGGTKSSITECDGTRSEVCSLPDGDSCYLNMLQQGSCVGIMSPRVLCDNEQQTSACVKAGGKEGSLAECDGSQSRVCTLPSGDSCYTDGLVQGGCVGTFIPKVQCDNLSDCELAGGIGRKSSECDGSSSEVCQLPDGTFCYSENVVDGKCVGIFSPKVLCDNGR